MGAGAGDLDPKANFRCGFTEFIKKNYKKNDIIFAVEANKLNIKKLKKCWKNYPKTKILNLAISGNYLDKKKKTLYYTEQDKPHYQVCSMDINHVKKHYPKSIIKKFSIEAIMINQFFKRYIKKKCINFLSLDLEGVDYEIVMSINFKKYDIKNLSIEHLHLTKIQKIKMIHHLSASGYSYCGSGYDHNNFDYLFKKKRILFNKILSRVLFIISRKHLNIFNKLLFNK